MARQRRRLFAWMGILGIVFAQVAVTAHACLTGTAVHATAAKAVAMAHEGHCAGVAPSTPPMTPLANACEVQCTDGALATAAPDLPPVMLAVLPVAPASMTLPISALSWDVAVLAATRAQPPPQLRFGRFLN